MYLGKILAYYIVGLSCQDSYMNVCASILQEQFQTLARMMWKIHARCLGLIL